MVNFWFLADCPLVHKVTERAEAAGGLVNTTFQDCDQQVVMFSEAAQGTYLFNLFIFRRMCIFQVNCRIHATCCPAPPRNRKREDQTGFFVQCAKFADFLGCKRKAQTGFSSEFRGGRLSKTRILYNFQLMQINDKNRAYLRSNETFLGRRNSPKLTLHYS